MKKFISELLLFITVCLLIIVTSALFLRSAVNKKALFNVKPTTNYIILGHSHPECAFNDSLIPGFSNYAKSAESYLYTFIKIKKIVEQNENVKGIFLEFSNYQVDLDFDEWIWRDASIYNYYYRYAAFTNMEDNMIIARHNPAGWLDGVRVSLRNSLDRLLRNDLNYLNGGYLYLVRDRLASDLKNQMNTEKVGVAKTDISSVNLTYLDKIINYCKEKQVKLYLIRSPIHPGYVKLKNEKVFIDLYLSRYANTEFLDFAKLPLSNTEFGDPEHLNYRGARKFSIWFNQLIEGGLLNEPNKQLFINEKMKLGFQ